MGKKLTLTQQHLLDKLRVCFKEKSINNFDEIKKEVNVKSFDSTFNALLSKGWVKRDVNMNSNNFKLS